MPRCYNNKYQLKSSLFFIFYQKILFLDEFETFFFVNFIKQVSCNRNWRSERQYARFNSYDGAH